MATHDPAGLLQLQRTVGNRATTLLVQRAPVMPRGRLTGYQFVVGTELSVAFAQAAKAAVRAGTVGAAELSALRTSALTGDESVSDHERMFMAGLLDRGNAAALNRAAFARAGDKITFPAASITAARRATVEAVDRPTMPSGIAALEKSATTALQNFDVLGALGHLGAANAAAVVTIARVTDTFAPSAAKSMALAQANGLFPADLLKGMLAAASDGTAGDLALAAAALAIAHAEGLPTFADLAAGRIKVDQVPASAMPGGPSHNADYITIAQAGGSKGDTVYLPSALDVDNAFQWSVVVHELQHAADDKAAGGANVQWSDKARLELAGYRAQGASIIRRLAAVSGAAQTTMAGQIAAALDPLLLGGIVVATRSSRATADPLIVKINGLLPAGNQVPAAQLSTFLSQPVTVIETRLLQLIAQAYSLAPGATAPLDGLSGESVVDWINRI